MGLAGFGFAPGLQAPPDLVVDVVQVIAAERVSVASLVELELLEITVLGLQLLAVVVLGSLHLCLELEPLPLVVRNALQLYSVGVETLL